MTAISSRVLADAEIHFRGLTFDERVKLADEVHARQPNLFFSVLALQLQEATLEQMEVVLNILLVYYTAMRLSGHKWPVISEDDQERCLKRVTGRVRFLDGLTAQQQSQVINDAITAHPEKPMLAYLYGTLRENGYLSIDSESQKMMMLVGLNMVECIAEAASTKAKRKR
jgi:hypothetical protein